MDKIKNKNFNKIIIFTLAFIMLASVFCFFIKFNQNQKVADALYIGQVNQLAENVEISENLEKYYQADKVTTVYNFVVPVRFVGETDIMQQYNSTYSLTNYQLLQQMFNSEDHYSVKKYYQVVSNGRLNLETIFILDNNKSLELAMTRSSMGNKNYNGGVGYDPNRTIQGYIPYSYVLEYQMLSQICGFALDIIEQDYNLNCDYDNDGFIDSLSISIQPDPQTTPTVVNHSDLLWPHSSEIQTALIQISGSAYGIYYDNFHFTNDNGQDILYGKYMMSDFDLTNNIATNMPKNNADIHELGHVLGFPDYYVYDNIFENTVSDSGSSVLVWDIMGYNHLYYPQYPLSYNRLKQNWIDEQNVDKIYCDGVYSLLPVNYEEVNGISLTNRTVAYKIVSDDYPDQAFYFEYRKQTSGSFENNSGYMNDGLIVYRVDEGFQGAMGYQDMLSAGNFAATPYNIYVFRNSINGYTQTQNCQFAATLNPLIKSMGDDQTYDYYGKTVETCDLTWQVYSANKSQDQYLPSEVTEVDSGIQVKFLSIDSTTGLLTFEISNYKPQITLDDFASKELYDRVLEACGATYLYDDAVEDLTYLDLNNLSLTSLKGLELLNFANLQVLDLSVNSLSNYNEILNFININPNIKINLAFNNFNLTNLPASLKTDNIIVGFQNVNNLKDNVIFYSKNSTINFKVDFYANNYTDVTFNQVSSIGNTYALSLGKNTLTMSLNTDVFEHEASIDIYVVKAYLSNDNSSIERNSDFPQIIIEGIAQDNFTITQTPSNIDTSVITPSNFNVNWNIVFNLNTSQTKQLSYTFKIVDTTAPVVVLNGNEKIESVRGQNLDLPSTEITVTDNNESVVYSYIENPLSTDTSYWSKKYYRQDNLTEVTEIDISNIGIYLIKYYACDQSGNKSEYVTRTVEITPVPITRQQIKDDNLYNAICQITGKIYVYENSLADYDIIDLSNKQIQSVEGLELLAFKQNAVINLNQNGLSDIEQINTLTNQNSDIVILLHCNNFDNYNNLSHFDNIDQISLGLQSIQFGIFVENGNVTQDIQYIYYGNDNHFTLGVNSYASQTGLNTITAYGKYDFVFNFKYSVPSINETIEFGAINFDKESETIEVFSDYSINVIFDYFTEESFDCLYYVDNVPVTLQQIDINKTLGEKVIKVLFYYNSQPIRTIEKKYIVQDTTAPQISFVSEENIYLKTGQDPEILGLFEVQLSDNYYAQDDIEIICETDFVNNQSGIYTYYFSAKDTSENISSIISKKVYVGNVTAKQNLVFEYNQSYQTSDLFDFEVYELQDFDIESLQTIDTSQLSNQRVLYQLIHKKSSLTFNIDVNVSVKDRTAPVVALAGSKYIEMFVNSTFNEPGFVAIDNHDGDISSSVIRTGFYNTDMVGVYRLKYSVTDLSGNTSQEVVREICVLYKPMPQFQLKTLQTQQSFAAGEKVEFAVVLTGINAAIYNINTDFDWYVDGKLVYSGPEKTFSYTFDQKGKHDVVAKVNNILLNNEVSVTESQQLTVIVTSKGFIQQYGLFIIAGVASLIIIVIVVSFIVARKRKFYF